jgi:hypothetical protein
MKFIKFIFYLLGVLTVWFFDSCKNSNDKGKTVTKTSDKMDNGFTKKDDTIWFYDIVLQNVDPNTFNIVDDYFFKDKNHVYFYESYRTSEDYFTSKRKRYLLLEKADPASFIGLGFGYAKDKNTAWYNESPFQVDDLESLVAINRHFISDNNTSYLERRPIKGSDGISFELISDHYAKDFNRYYYCLPYDDMYTIKPILCNYKTFEVMDYQYAKDNTYVFYEGDVLPKAESNSFVLISNGYAKDAIHVYLRDKIVEKADPTSFTPFKENEYSLGETVYAKDKNGIFVNDKYFSETDVASFKILNEKYTLDKNGVYYQMKKIKNADPLSFKVYPHFMGDADAEDENNKYADGKIVE